MTSKQPEYRTMRLRSFEFQLYYILPKSLHQTFKTLYLYAYLYAYVLAMKYDFLLTMLLKSVLINT